jgi:rhodanese-related sulfurtransferase
VTHIPLSRLQDEAASVPRDRPVVFQCRVGGRSTMAAQAFRASGFEAYSLDGGLIAWEAEGMPITPAGVGVANH